MKDIDWNGDNVRATGMFYLTMEFKDDPMMQLFSDDARTRLASYLVSRLAEADNPNIYQAYNLVAYDIMPRSPYGAFGTPFAQKVGALVQKSLYPATYEREYVSSQ